MLTSILKKVCHITILAIVLVVPVLYPLKLDDTLVTNLTKKFHSLNLFQFFQDNIEPIIFYTYSPLVLKETIAEAFIIFLFVTYLFYLFFKSDKNDNPNSFLRQNLPLILFVAYAGISVFYSPTFYYSFRSWFHIVCFSLFFLLVRELADSPAFLRKTIIIILAVSGLLCLVAILQHLNLATWFLPKFDEPRNRIGSFIGHNTGLSMFLLPSFFLCLSLLISGTRKLVKVLILILLIIEIFILLAAQSRGTWLVLIITLPLFLLSARNYINFKLTKRHVMIALLIILAILLSQNLPSPLYSREVSFSQRIQHFSPARLLTETRLRILVCSFPLIKEKPILGHGIGSFQYVYPKVQGEYFVRNPHSILWPTGKRSQHAHNDYLQLLIELGLLGCVLLLSALYIYLRYGWNTFLQNKDTSSRAIQLALFFSLTSILLQAFVDFPFHISPVGLYLVFILALWSANSKLFLPETEKKENIPVYNYNTLTS
ncbi:MAG: O-antigen ligase family protein, partial [Candidatus Sumerlaeia bacterium]|nr:O-antigen ligase family protein [Candidatus Sumerlaeia bacterium]